MVLAAGKGTRLNSRVPKVLYPLCGRPMLEHVLRAVQGAGIEDTVIVTPPNSRQIRRIANGAFRSAVQQEPLGTGHAVLAAAPLLEARSAPSSGKKGTGKLPPEHVVVLAGDAPLLSAQTLRGLMEHHVAEGADVTMLTAIGLPPDGLGRVVRDGNGAVARVVEERDSAFQQQRIQEMNSGIYCFRAAELWPRLREVRPSRAGELYLTGVIDLTARAGGRVTAFVAPDPWDAFGVNTRQQLAQATAVMRQRLCRWWMDQGVTILDPASTFLDATVTIGRDTVLYPNTHLYGDSRVGRECALGPGAVIVDSRIGERCRVMGSLLEGAVLERRVEVGPFCHLRPGAHLHTGVHLGNFVEVKESTLGPGTAAGHFSYIGDASIGSNVNIGAGTVTCNYDGKRKHRTVVGDEAFIGSDTMLVAPVRVGARSATGAGSVVTHDVPDDTLVVGVPAKPRRRPDL